MRLIIKYSTQLMMLGALLTVITSCSNDERDTSNFVYDCEFVQDDTTNDGLIDATERSIMENCGNSKFTNLSEIKDNLTGDWELVGHGEGWLRKISQPCALISFRTNNSLEFQYQSEYIDTSSIHDWELIEGRGNYSLKITPRAQISLRINTFCSNYMFVDETAFDGNMYLFRKVN